MLNLQGEKSCTRQACTPIVFLRLLKFHDFLSISRRIKDKNKYNRFQTSFKRFSQTFSSQNVREKGVWTRFDLTDCLHSCIMGTAHGKRYTTTKFSFFVFFTDSYVGFNEESSIENRLKKYWVITKLRRCLWHAFTCICMTRHDFNRGFLHFAAADVVYLFAWAAPMLLITKFFCLLIKPSDERRGCSSLTAFWDTRDQKSIP